MEEQLLKMTKCVREKQVGKCASKEAKRKEYREKGGPTEEDLKNIRGKRD